MNAKPLAWLMCLALVVPTLIEGGNLKQESSSMVPLIPRRALFDCADRESVSISPNGQYISYVAPWNGAPNLWVGPSTDIHKAQQITFEKEGISGYDWSAHSDYLLIFQDNSGDENWRLYQYHLPNKKRVVLGDDAGVQTQLLGTSHKKPYELIISNNKRNNQFHDVFRVDMRKAEKQLIYQNDEFISFVFDSDLNLRFATKPTPKGNALYQFIRNKPQHYLDLEGEDVFDILKFSQDQDSIYVLDNRNRNTTALSLINLKTGQTTILADDDRCDIEGVRFHPTQRTVDMVYINYLKPKYSIIDSTITDDCVYLDGLRKDPWFLISGTQDHQTWLVVYDGDGQSNQYYLYDRKTQQAHFLCASRQKLDSYQLSPMRPKTIKARDGLSLVSYLTLPAGNRTNRNGVPSQPLPMVLLVHGGPWSRDSWGFNEEHQWLANRGYAVLSVNFRGSTGFGKNFVQAGNKQWGKKMHEDLLDAVQWAVDNGIADPSKVAIMGGSYGGYATLVGLTLTPNVFACGVDLVGISNLLSFVDAIPAYWKPLSNQLRQRIGNWDDPTERAAMIEVSPVNHAHKIVKPLFMAQGGRDPRVKPEESEQLVSAMQQHKIPVLYAFYEYVGHGFTCDPNNLSFRAMVELFLAKNLGGRADPIQRDLNGAYFLLNDQFPPSVAWVERTIQQSIAGVGRGDQTISWQENDNAYQPYLEVFAASKAVLHTYPLERRLMRKKRQRDQKKKYGEKKWTDQKRHLERRLMR